MNSNTAIYSANFEESITVENWSPLHDSRSNIIWEGHGTLNSILNDDHNSAQVTGKLTESDKGGPYDCYVEVLIQLHPIIRHAIQHNNENQHYLPPMRSIWNSNEYSTTNNTTTSSSSSSSPPTAHHHNTSPTIQQQNRHHHHHHQSTSPPSHRQLNVLQFPIQRDDTHRLPSFNSTSSSSPLPREMPKEEAHHSMYPPALDPNWPGCRYDSSSYDQETIKRRKLSPPLHQHQHQQQHLSPSSSSLPSQQQHLHSNNTKLVSNHHNMHRHSPSSTKPSSFITTNNSSSSSSISSSNLKVIT